jgi:hypothetical protein
MFSSPFLNFSTLAHVQFPRPDQFPVSLTSSVLRFRTLVSSLFPVMASSPIPRPGQFSISLSCSFLRFHALASSSVLCLSVFRFYAPSSSVACLSVICFCTIGQFSLHHWSVLCFPVLSSYPFPYPGQSSGFLSWPVLTSHFCPA